VAVLIPSIDLMGGRIVQLVQGERKALEFSDFDYWIERFRNYPIVQLIDLDAAMGRGSNRDLLQRFTGALPCQVGGGIRTLVAAEQTLALGARRIIVGSALFRDGSVDQDFACQLSDRFGRARILAAIDSKNGRIAVKGWRESSPLTPLDAIAALDPFCGGFLYTHVDTEGLMQGIPLEIIRQLRAATSLPLIAAGGITTREEVEELDRLGVDSVVGMAIYTGRMAVD
jgi:phosphoribosylformimino-5-aminoimidazole carboxamide ribotide isomerase